MKYKKIIAALLLSVISVSPLLAVDNVNKSSSFEKLLVNTSWHEAALKKLIKVKSKKFKVSKNLVEFAKKGK